MDSPPLLEGGDDQTQELVARTPSPGSPPDTRGHPAGTQRTPPLGLLRRPSIAASPSVRQARDSARSTPVEIPRRTTPVILEDSDEHSVQQTQEMAHSPIFSMDEDDADLDMHAGVPDSMPSPPRADLMAALGVKMRINPGRALPPSLRLSHEQTAQTFAYRLREGGNPGFFLANLLFNGFCRMRSSASAMYPGVNFDATTMLEMAKRGNMRFTLWFVLYAGGLTQEAKLVAKSDPAYWLPIVLPAMHDWKGSVSASDAIVALGIARAECDILSRMQQFDQ